MAIVTTDDKHYRDIAATIKSYDLAWKDSGIKPSEMAGAVDDVYGVGKIDGYVEAQLDEQAIYNRGLAAGKQAERDRFWDNFQDHGKRTNYGNDFRSGFTDENFYPRYDIVTTAASNMFYDCMVTDLKGRLAECGVSLDTSAAANLYYFGFHAGFTHVPEIGNTKVINAQNCLNACPELISVDRIILSTTSACSMEIALANCPKLVELRFNDGVRPKSLNLKTSTVLSRASLENIVNSIAADFTTSITVSKTAVEAAFPNIAEWDALCNSKPNLTVVEG